MFDKTLHDNSEILALAGERDAPVKHSRKRRTTSSKDSVSKRREREITDDSKADGETEEGEEEELEYPLEGKFKDEADREHLMSLSEIKREEILSRRIEEVQKKIDRRDLKRMIKSLAGARGSTDELEESEQSTIDAPPPTTKAPRLKPLPEDYFSQSSKVRPSNEQKLFVGSWIALTLHRNLRLLPHRPEDGS
ncbi:hypothetical protein FRC04_001551 [Tulasnella sp. 424]|nr:hypothetical protein FRC04_001551 [Tulasnella sp. 424]